jgi:hypothetical protein
MFGSYPDYVNSMSLSPDGTRLIVGSSLGEVSFIDTDLLFHPHVEATAQV